MKIQITIIATAILATILIATPTILSNSLIKTASAKTTHGYCYVANSVSTTFDRCYVTLSECQAAEKLAGQEGYGEVKISKECYKFTNSDKSTNNYCFDLLPNDGKLCSSSKKECESVRESFKASRVGYRTGSECYRT